MKFFLINPYFKLYGDPPLGLCYLASYIRKHVPNVEIKILDLLEDDEVIRALAREKPEFIGISAVSQNYYRAVELGGKIKRAAPNSLLIIGGVHITVSPASFNNSPFDLGVRGEGEIPTRKFFELFNKENKINLSKLSKIPGFLIRRGEEIIDTGLSEQVKNLDDIPLPARDLLDMDFYRLPRFSIETLDANGAIITSRGCPYACKFCCSSAFWGRTIRFHSAERVVQEIKLLYKKYGYKLICIYDDLFSVNKERLRQIVSLLEKEGLLGKIEFDALARANCFDDEIAQLFKKMGITTITFGFETGSPKILSYLKGNNVKIEEGIRALNIARRYGLRAGGFFMVGAPTETIEDIKQTYDFIKRNKPDNAIIFQLTAFPGTECWDYAVKNNIMKEDAYDTRDSKYLQDLIDINQDLLLSKDISKQQFTEAYYKLKSLVRKKKQSPFSRLLKIRPRHIRAMLSKSFFKKASTLRHNFLKEVGIVK